MVKSENYINIQGWMVTELKLSGNELLCYALIYGFSQDGESYFSASSKYISEWLNISRRSVIDLLDRMTKKGILEKTEKTINGVKLCDYRVTSHSMKKVHRGSEETSQGGEESSHHNIIDNIKDNNIKEKSIINNTLKEKQENPKVNEIVEKLKSVLEKYKGRSLNTSKWKEPISKMLRIDKLNPDEIIDNLEWYADYIGDDYIPVIESGSSLREKYGKLEYAMNKKKKEVKEKYQPW